MSKKKEEMKDLVKSGKAFVLREESEPEVVQLTFDEIIDLAYVAYQEKSKAEKRFNEFKNEIKSILEARKLAKYRNESGVEVALNESQRTSYQKDLLVELLGEDYTRCIKISKSKRFEIKKQ